MLLIIGTIRISAAPDVATSAMERMISASRAEAGCLEYVYSWDATAPGLVHVKEIWTSRSALDAHFASPHLAEWRSHWPELGIGDRNLALYEIGQAEAI